MEQQTLKERREAAGKTLRQMADAVGVTERTYWQWERDNRVPDTARLFRLADVFGVDARALMDPGDLTPVSENGPGPTVLDLHEPEKVQE